MAPDDAIADDSTEQLDELTEEMQQLRQAEPVTTSEEDTVESEMRRES